MATDTIAAVATPPGNGGVAIIRVSGPSADLVLRRVMPRLSEAVPSMMVYGDIVDGNRKIDSGYGVFFPGPRSYTGEDTAEIQCHGGAVVTGQVLAAVLRAGARAAEPGEFTKRAFVNGRMDLSQAEAVGDLIGAVSEKGAELARRNIRGALRDSLEDIQNLLTDSVARLEAALEYPDEDLTETDVSDVLPLLRQAHVSLGQILRTWKKGRILRDGLKAVFVGSPNAGKSSLFNALCRENRSIVATVPGTTRDVVESTIMSVDGVMVVLADTAGLHDSDDPIEREGMARARATVEDSDLIIFVLDGSANPTPEDRELLEEVKGTGKQILAVLSKADLPMALSQDAFEDYLATPLIPASVVTEGGLQALEEEISDAAGANLLAEESVAIAGERQREHVARALDSLAAAIGLLQEWEISDLACTELREAWDELGCVIGNTADEEIIDRIFSKFCLGK